MIYIWILIICQTKDKTKYSSFTQIFLTKRMRKRLSISSLYLVVSLTKSLKLNKQVHPTHVPNLIHSQLRFFLEENISYRLHLLLAPKNHFLCLPLPQLNNTIIQILIIQPTTPLVTLHLNTLSMIKTQSNVSRDRERTAYSSKTFQSNTTKWRSWWLFSRMKAR